MMRNNIKKLLREGLEQTISKISIFDFDGTLFDSPSPDGKNPETGFPTSSAYRESKHFIEVPKKQGQPPKIVLKPENYDNSKDWPFQGWWGRNESLSMDLFDIKPISAVISDYNKEKVKPNTLVVMMTGRIPKNAKHVENILQKYNLTFDDYIYKKGSATLEFKIKVLNNMILNYPNLREIDMWEDRPEHTSAFRAWGEDKNVEVTVNQV